MPSVSIIIPTCNRPAYLRQAIESIFAQTFADWEIIVVDDRPSEDTRAVAAAYPTHVTYVTGEQAGPSRARNRGIQAARGELISFLDDDDLMLPDNLSLLAHYLHEHPTIGCAYGWYTWIEPSGRVSAHAGPKIAGAAPVLLPSGETVLPCGTRLQGAILAPLLLEESLLLGCSLIRRDWITRCGGFDPTVSYQEHWDFYLRLAEAGCLFACRERVVSLHRLHHRVHGPGYGNRGQDHGRMLKARLAVLDRFLQSATLNPALAAIRDQAYFNAYTAFIGVLIETGQQAEWQKAFSRALDYAPHGTRSVDAVGKLVAGALRRSNEAGAPRVIHELYKTQPRSRAVRRACRTALGRAYLHQAKCANESNASRARVLLQACQAVFYDPRLALKRSLHWLVLEQFLTAGMRDWVKFLRKPLPTVQHYIQPGGDVLFLSPHFDDAVLSCGGILAALPKDQTWLVTVFTSAAQTNFSPLASLLHQQWGGDAQIYAHRQAEDTCAANHLGVRAIWLGLSEVIYRDATLNSINGIFSADLTAADIPCLDAVREQLIRLIQDRPGCTVFAPLGLGYHRDHVIVHAAARDVERHFGDAVQFFYYEDFPYAKDSGIKRRLKEIGVKLRPTAMEIDATLNDRIETIKLYRSQVNALFGDPDNATQHVRRYAVQVGIRGKPRERFWRAEKIKETETD